MKKLLLLIIAAFFSASCACALEATYPNQSGLDAAMAVSAMHTAVMRDVLGSEYSFSELAGGDYIFVLFTDEDDKNYLMVSLTDEKESRADMAIIQCYTLKEFETNGLDSLTAIAMPFIPEENFPEFESWRDSTCKTVADAYRKNTDVELTYYTGKYVTCAMSYTCSDPDAMLFTLIVSWNTPLTADDISSIMEAPEDEH